MKMMAIWLTAFYLVAYYIKEYFKRRKSPPGPWPIPILGNVLQVRRAAKLPDIAFSNLASEYGKDIMRLKLGSQDYVVLSSYEAITEVLSHPDALGRPLDSFSIDRNDGKKIGFGFSEGETWKTKRNWTIQTLRTFGFDKSIPMENMTMGMVHSFLKDMEQHIPNGEGIFDVNQAFTIPVFKIAWQMLAGRCTLRDETIISRLLEKSDKMLKSGSWGVGLGAIFPFIKYLAPESTGYRVQMDFYNDTKSSGRGLLKEMEFRMNGNYDNPKNLTEAYVSKVKSGDVQNFYEEDFGVLFLDLLQAASDTTSSFLESSMLFLIRYPEVQAKICEEIEICIPKAQDPTVADLDRMMYTQAFMVEVHRVAKVVQNLVPRRATKDFYYKNYLIKEDTTIISDLHTAVNDIDKFGKDVENFRPERFLSEEGNLKDNTKYVVAFGAGKRICPGAASSELSAFLFLVSILQKFELSTVPGEELPTTEMNVGFTSRPHPFKMWIKHRV